MATVQGDFADRDAATRAKTALTESGIAAAHIRIWNILPDTAAGSSGGSGAAKGALVGGAIAGGTGLVLGAAIGNALEDGPHLPLPSGVRVVVDTNGDEAAIRANLRSSGAANIVTVE